MALLETSEQDICICFVIPPCMLLTIFMFHSLTTSCACVKKQLKGRHFSSDIEVIAAEETWLDGQPSDFFLTGLQKLEFGHCSLFPSWSG